MFVVSCSFLLASLLAPCSPYLHVTYRSSQRRLRPTGLNERFGLELFFQCVDLTDLQKHQTHFHCHLNIQQKNLHRPSLCPIFMRIIVSTRNLSIPTLDLPATQTSFVPVTDTLCHWDLSVDSIFLSNIGRRRESRPTWTEHFFEQRSCKFVVAPRRSRADGILYGVESSCVTDASNEIHDCFRSVTLLICRSLGRIVGFLPVRVCVCPSSHPPVAPPASPTL